MVINNSRVRKSRSYKRLTHQQWRKSNVALKECYNNGLLGVGMDAASASLNIKLSIK